MEMQVKAMKKRQCKSDPVLTEIPRTEEQLSDAFAMGLYNIQDMANNIQFTCDPDPASEFAKVIPRIRLRTCAIAWVVEQQQEYGDWVSIGSGKTKPLRKQSAVSGYTVKVAKMQARKRTAAILKEAQPKVTYVDTPVTQ